MQAYSISKKIGLITGPLLFLLLYNLPGDLITEQADKIIAVAIWMVVWWVTEAVSISVTALIPLTIFPLLGIMDMGSVGAKYGSPIVFLFFGGFVIALALEKVNLHKRIALNIIKITGTSPDRVVLGFMIATAALSMWISNTATTVVMLPIALSVLHLLINDEDGFTKGDQNFALSIMLGIAFAANVGGVATLIGTPPNVLMAGFLEDNYGIEVSFLNWLMIGLPFSIIMLGAIYFVLVKWMYPNNLTGISDSKKLIDREVEKLGPIKGTETQVLTIFFITIFCWIFLNFINDVIPMIHLSNTTISMLAAMALFAIPFKFNSGEFILEWKDAQKLPWGILILFGGGLALAGALSDAGVIEMIGKAISENGTISILLVTSLLIFVMLFMTELMGNAALVVIFAPVVAGIALGLEVSFFHLLIPVTIASSCAFMLPMATPPNAIVFASGHIKVHEMVRAGVVLNVIAVLLLIVWAQFVIPLVF